MNRTPRSSASAALRLALLLGVWLSVTSLLVLHTWDLEGLAFGTLLLLAGLGAGWLARPGAEAPSPEPRILGILLGVALVLAAGRLGWILARELQDPGNARWAMDIGLNTHAAGSAFLAGQNPYAAPAQLWHTLQPGPHVSVQDGTTRLFGLPYRYGFPYFPALFASYLPFRVLHPGLAGLRLGNAAFLAAGAAAAGALARGHAPAGWTRSAGLASALACLGAAGLGIEAFRFAVTDIAIGCYLACGFLLLQRGRWKTSGCVFGLAQACKLLPAPLLVLAVAAWAWGRPGLKGFLAAYGATAAAVLLPFLWLDGRLFLSSTVLFYLANHAGGDETALAYFLPAWGRAAFALIGALAALGIPLLGARHRHQDALAPAALGFAAFAVFTAFAPMSHLNYLWSVFPLGCAALAAGAAGRA